MSAQGVKRMTTGLFAACLAAVLTATVPAVAEPAGTAEVQQVRKPRQRPARKPAQRTPTPAPQPEEAEPQAQPDQPVEIPPEVQAQLDEMAQRDRSRQPAQRTTQRQPTTRRTPAQRRSRGVPAGRAPGAIRGEAAQDQTGGAAINIPPSDQASVPPEERLYSFAIKDAPYSVLIEGIARQTGLGVLGEAPPDGTVTFVTEEQLSFNELLNRVRHLLFNYKPIDPYWLLREENGLRVIRVVDYLRDLSPEKIFQSVELFREANLPDEDLVLVLFTPKSGSLADLTMVRDFLPDYVRVTPMEDRNTVAIFALVRDIEKYLELVDIFVSPGSTDPRTLEIVPVEFITPTTAWEQISKLMEVDDPATGRVRSPRGARGAPGASPLEDIPEPAISVVPDDAQGVLIVRAMQDKIGEIKSLLAVVDVDTHAAYLPVVIEVKYNDPATLIETIQTILASGDTSGTAGTAQPDPRRRGGRRRVAPNPQAAAGDSGPTLIPHPAGTAIIVMADDDTVAQVRELVRMLDLETTIGPIPIAIQYADPESLVTTITQMLTGIAGASAGRKGQPVTPGNFAVVTDPGGDKIWFTGSPKELERVRQLVAEMDRAEDAPTLRTVRLVNQKPSFVAQILTQFDGGGGKVANVPTARGRRRRATPRPQAAAADPNKFNANDETRRLYILCTEAEWEQYKAIIDDLESEPPLNEYELVEVQHIAPDEAIEKIQSMMLAAGGAAPGKPGTVSSLRFVAADAGFLVMGATPAEMNTIRGLLAEFDRAIEIEQRTFEIRYVNPTELKTAIETLLSDGTTPANPRRATRRRGGQPQPGAAGPATGDMTIVQVENSLVVKAPPDLMQQVADFIEEFDVPTEKPEVRVYADFPAGSDLDSLVAQLTTLLGFDAAASATGRGAKPGAPPTEVVEAPRFIPQPASNRLIVMAPLRQFEEIETMLEILRSEVQVAPVVTEFIPVQFADPQSIVEQIEPLLLLQVEQLVAEGEVGEAASEGTPASPQPRARVRRAPRQPASAAASPSAGKTYHIAADVPNSRIVIAAEEPIVDAARKLVEAFDLKGSESESIEVAYIPVQHADPQDIVDAIEPVLAIKVDELMAVGDISPETPTAAPQAPGNNPTRRNVRRGQALIKRGAGDARPYHLAADPRQHRVVIAGPRTVIELTRGLVSDFDLPGAEGGGVVVAYVEVKYASPTELVEQIDPVLSLRVQQFISDETIAPEPDAVAPAGTAKPAPRLPRGRTGAASPDGRRYHLEPDERNKQIVVAAPQPIVDEVRALVADLDKPSDDEELVFETVVLNNADPAAMVQTITAMMTGTKATGPRSRPTVRRKAGAAAQTPTAPTAGSDAETGFTIVEAPGGNAVVLQGTRPVVDQAKERILLLDAQASGERVVRVYNVAHADLKQLVNMIMSLLGVEEKSSPTRRSPVRRPGGAAPLEEDEPFEFVTEITKTAPDLYLHADLIERTLTVAATPTKLAVIEGLIGQVEDEDVQISKPVLPQLEVALKYKDAYDAAFELEGLLDALWQPRDQIPEVDYTSVGNMLVIRYPDQSAFPRIREYIEQYIDRPSDKPAKRLSLPTPSGMSPEALALWIKTNLAEYDVEVQDRTSTVEVYPNIEEVKPYKPSGVPCVLPASLLNATNGVLATLAGQTPPEEEPAGEPVPDEQPAEETPPVEEEYYEEPVEQVPPVPDPVDEAILDRVTQPAVEEVPPGADEPAAADRDLRVRRSRTETIRVYFDNNTGDVIIEGPEDVLEEVPELMQDLEKEIDKLNRPPDIRIIRVKYIDVYTAETIINEMFNATRQQQQTVQQMQRQQAAQTRRAQLQLQRQQQLQQQQQQGKQQGRQPQQQQIPQPQIEIPQLPTAAVRVYPNPRDRTLILRADTHQYNAIYKLLATIDRPKPIDSEHRIYKLARLNAVEVEEMLRSWLGLDSQAAQQRRSATGRGRRGGVQQQPTLEPGAELPETLVAPIEGEVGGLGIDPADIKLSSNAETNTVLAMAPKVALDYIGRLIDELEGAAGADRTWRSYQLSHASVEETVEFLAERFADERDRAQSGASNRRSGRSGSSEAAAAAGGLNSPTFVPYPRLNMISVQATEEQLTEIESLLKRLDVPAANEEFRHVVLAHADAAIVAETLTALFGEGSAPRGRGGRGGPAPAEGPTFVGEEGGKVVFFKAPEADVPRIMQVVEQLEEQSKAGSVLRLIQLEFARPSEVAAAIESAYGSGRRSSAPRGRGGQTTGVSAAGLTVTANDPTRQLFVMADDATFAEVESLARSMDQPAQMGFDFRIYRLQFADARKIHTTMTKLVQDYLRMMPRDSQLEAFSVQPDEKANALVVLGSPVIFGFVEKTLREIDIPANARSEDAAMMVVLKNGDAMEVAQSINRLWTTRVAEGEDPPQAEAIRSLNALSVRGTREQLDEIRKEFIDPLESQAAERLLSETFDIQFADAEDIAQTLMSMYEAKKKAIRDMGPQAGVVPAIDQAVVVTADPATNQLLVQASADNLADIRERIAQLDVEEVANRTQVSTRVYVLRHADPDAVARMIQGWSQAREQRYAGGRGAMPQSEMVLAVAEAGTRSVVVTASAENHQRVQEVVNELDSDEIAAQAEQVRTFVLRYADPAVVVDAVDQLFKAAGGKGGTGGVSAVAGGGRSVVVSGSSSDLARISDLIEKLDSPDVGQQQVHVINLQNTDAQSVSDTLNEIFVQSASRGRSPGAAPVSISALDGSKAIIVRASPDDYTRILTAVQELDREEALVGDAVQVVTLLYTDATEMHEVLQESLRKPGATGGRGKGGEELVGNTRISVLAQTNAIVISGERQKVDELVALVNDMDKAGEFGSVPQIILLEHAKVNQVLPSVQAIFEEQRGGGGRGQGQSPPVITANGSLNALIVRAGPTDMAAIKSIVRGLDTEQVAKISQFRIVQVNPGLDIEELAGIVEQNINESAAKQAPQGGRQQEVPSITVSTDARTSSLIIGGSTQLYDGAEELALELSKRGPAGEPTTRIFKTNNLTQEDLETLIEQVTNPSMKDDRSGRSRSSGGRGSSRPARSPRSSGGGR